MEQIRFIINPIAGTRRKISEIREAITRTLSSSQAYDIVLTEKPRDGALLAAEAAARNYSLIVAVGGDGTVNEVATSLVNTPCCLGIIPTGSGNGLARELDLPRDPAQACRTLFEGGTIEIDVGMIAQRYFFSTSGIGFDARISEVFNSRGTGRRGLLFYILLTAREILRYAPSPVSVRIDGRQYFFRPLILSFSNTRQYGNGAIIAPGAKLNDGLVDLCMIPPLHPLRCLVHLPKLFSGKVDQVPGFFQSRGSTIEIFRQGSGTVQVDGENFQAEAALTVSTLPRSLRVRCPATTVRRVGLAPAESFNP